MAKTTDRENLKGIDEWWDKARPIIEFAQKHYPQPIARQDEGPTFTVVPYNKGWSLFKDQVKFRFYQSLNFFRKLVR